MLVLTRKVGEKIHIGDNVVITVMEVGPGRVKIGVDAPRDIPVDRAEIAAAKVADGTLSKSAGQKRPATA